MFRFRQTIPDRPGVLVQVEIPRSTALDWDRLTGCAWYARGEGSDPLAPHLDVLPGQTLARLIRSTA